MGRDVTVYTTLELDRHFLSEVNPKSRRAKLIMSGQCNKRPYTCISLNKKVLSIIHVHREIKKVPRFSKLF